MEIDTGAKRHCHRCGTPVAAQDDYCQECGAAVMSGVGRTCRECAAALSPTAHFCPRCGARQAGGAWSAGFAGGWGQLRSRAAAVDWARAGRAALPVAALLAAGLVGYGIGLRAASSPPSSDRVASAARGWRGETGAPPRNAARVPARSGSGTRPETQTRPAAVVGTALPAASTLTRFRDFKIASSSYELANPPARAADGDPYTAWHAWETERYPEGDWLTLTFPTPRRVSRIGLIPGRVGPRADVDGRVRSILVKAPGAPPQKLIFDSRAQMQYRDLPKPVFTRTLTLRIVNVVPGRRSGHIIIPEVQVWGSGSGSQIARRIGG